MPKTLIFFHTEQPGQIVVAIAMALAVPYHDAETPAKATSMALWSAGYTLGVDDQWRIVFGPRHPTRPFQLRRALGTRDFVISRSP